MEPIISPWIFYWIDTANTLRIISVLAALVLPFVILFLVLVGNDYDTDEDCSAKMIWYAKRFTAALGVFITLIVFIPPKDTMYKMLVTSYVTPNNIELVGGSVDNMLDKLTDKIIRIKEAK